MFRHLAKLLGQPDPLLTAHPFELAWILEEVWRGRLKNGSAPGDPDKRSEIEPTPRLQKQGWPPLRTPGLAGIREHLGAGEGKFRWDHLIYAYMVENTRLYEIFRRVVYEFAHGEKLGTPTSKSAQWLYATEELFYKDGAPFFIASVNSHIRPDLRSNRRNAYHRMFSMELNHGTDDGKAYPYVKADAANGEFVPTFEELLREVWVGMTYVKATNSNNPTDDGKILTLISKLKNMLMSRRQHGNLAREEFSAVIAMSWFHMTLEYKNSNENAPIIIDLRADANGTEQRLFKVAERVGLPAHGLSKHYFDIADAISRILIQIESGHYDDMDAVKALYTRVDSDPNAPEVAMRTIITHWTAITGRDVKARKVSSA